MSKNTKKIETIENRIKQLEEEMKNALQKKKSGTMAYDVAGTTRKIADLRKDLSYLK
jgi:uncharacterized coiled-coil protein SlyX